MLSRTDHFIHFKTYFSSMLRLKLCLINTVYLPTELVNVVTDDVAVSNSDDPHPPQPQPDYKAQYTFLFHNYN